MSDQEKHPVRITMRGSNVRVSIELPAETATDEVVESIKRIVCEAIDVPCPQPFEL